MDFPHTLVTRMAMRDKFGNYQISPDTSGAESSTPFGGGPTASSGTADPNTLTLADSSLFYGQYDGNGVFLTFWARKDSVTAWVQVVNLNP